MFNSNIKLMNEWLWQARGPFPSQHTAQRTIREREPQDSLLGVSEQSCLLLNSFKWHLLSKEPEEQQREKPKILLEVSEQLKVWKKSLRRR